MTAKDYRAIAAILRRQLVISINEAEQWRVHAVAVALADHFAQDNTNFDRARFYKAVEI